jgi:antibiotic biosynthesis monooxygenase (ABM) superfamily enzyme
MHISRRIQPGREEDYERFVEAISMAAQAIPGFLNTTLLRPEPGDKNPNKRWVFLIR